MVSKRFIVILIVIWLTLLICGCEGNNSEEKIAPPDSTIIELPKVKVTMVKKGDISIPIETTGTIFPEYESKIGPKISGTIELVHVDEGDAVLKGQPLVQLDQKNLLIAVRQGRAAVRMAEAQLKEARVKVENLKKERERLSNLLKKNVISQQKYDDIDTAYSMAVTGMEVIRAQIARSKESLAMAEQQFSDTVINAPFSGLVVKRFINEGEFVSTMPPSSLFLIMNIDRVKSEIDLPEVHIAGIEIGNPVNITVDAYPGTVFEGKVSTINPMVDPLSRTFTVKVQIPNKDHRLTPGMFARVKIYPAIHKGALLVPFKSVLKRDGSSFVFIIDDGTARLREVKTGINNEREIEVIEGLEEGVEVIIEGHYGMPDNTKVSVERE
ncbi:MAG: efflux RND transporter periplasmic adaptor subunit [Deltaproteobacteria bacterium]|nr:efflux RND transporter periplasmic adaptor subunit [Deltaproteobacteria bacterium]